jgi:NAD(P)-dependent dehydrogenase (short-subunit alcohol dehydrogenase family)
LIDRPVAITGGSTSIGPTTLLARARKGATLVIGGFDESTHQ